MSLLLNKGPRNSDMAVAGFVSVRILTSDPREAVEEAMAA